MMKNFKVKLVKKTKESLWEKSQIFKDGFLLIATLKQMNLKASKRNFKIYTIQSCKKPTKALPKQAVVDNNIIKATNKAMLGQVQIKLIE